MGNDLSKNIQTVEKELTKLHGIKEKEENKNRDTLSKLKNDYEEKVNAAKNEFNGKMAELLPKIETAEKQKKDLCKLKQQMEVIMGASE